MTRRVEIDLAVSRKAVCPSLTCSQGQGGLSLGLARAGFGVVGAADWDSAACETFVDGCFRLCSPEHGHVPNVNLGYWPEKQRRNRERDRQANEHLRKAGWKVVRLWEHVPLEEAGKSYQHSGSRIAEGERIRALFQIIAK